MKSKTSISFMIFEWAIRILVLLFSVAPVYALLIMGLTPYANSLEPQIFPRYFYLPNFWEAFKAIYSYLANSFFYSILSVTLTLVVSIPAAYILARYEFKGKTAMLYGLLLTQMIAGIVILPSLYFIYSKLGFLNSRISLVVTFTGLNLALTTWLLIGFFASLPRAVEEAAYIDGISSLKLIIRIIIPMSIPGIAVGAIFTFINSYNEFLIPLFMLTKPSLQPITMKFFSLLSDQPTYWHLVGSAAVLGLLPPVLIFLFFQKYIISGITSGAVKN